jgi:hypothetical protein
MLAFVLVGAGVVATASGTWYGYAAARSALVPFLRDGDPTRALVEAAKPVHERARVRVAARSILAALVWIAVAMYGLYLVTAGMVLPA